MIKETPLSILVITCLILFLTPLSFGQEAQIHAGWRKEKINNEGELREELEEINRKNKHNSDLEPESLDGYTIDGRDIIEVIEETDLDIRITNSVIENGLIFTTSRIRAQDKHIVNNLIIINDSVIEAAEAEAQSIYAYNVFFTQDVNFHGAVFEGDAYFEEAAFSGNAHFGEAVFRNSAGFLTAVFDEYADFGKSEFRSDADFGFVWFRKDVNFSLAKFEAEAHFYKTEFGGNADFLVTEFEEIAHFGGADFAGDAHFDESAFRSNAHFREVSFLRDVDFTHAGFSSAAIFEGLESYGTTKLIETEFNGDVDFRNARINRFLFINHSLTDSIEASFDFRNATLTESHFEELDFTQEVNFSDVRFGKSVKVEADRNIKESNNIRPVSIFRFVNFESDASFTRTVFFGDGVFENVNFGQKANFMDSEFRTDARGNKPRLLISFVTFDDLIFDFDNFPDPENWVDERIHSFHDMDRKNDHLPVTGKRPQKLSEVFEQMHDMFASQGNLSAQNKAYYHMKVEELKEATKKDTFFDKFTTKAYWEWILWGWSSGWGTKIWRLVFIYIGILLFFGVSYWKFGKFYKPTKTESSELKLRILSSPSRFYRVTSDVSLSKRSFIDALKFSKELILKIGRSNIIVTGNNFFKAIVIVEWALGFYLLAILAITLKNTVPLINSLISGVF